MYQHLLSKSYNLLIIVFTIYFNQCSSYLRINLNSFNTNNDLTYNKYYHKIHNQHKICIKLNTKSPRDYYIHQTKSILNKILPIALTTITATIYMNANHIKQADASVFSSKNAILPFPKKGFQMKSGLKYFDYNDISEGKSPKYGQMISFYYTMYYRANANTDINEMELLDATANNQPFLQKHGNGRLIRGMEEALHTMKVGSKRRIIVPASLGYSSFGLGPLPGDPFQRRRLGDVIDLLDKNVGELIVDLELVMIRDDENDQGYYEDEPVTQDDVRKLVIKSLQADNPELFDKMKLTTPRELYKK